MGLGSGEKAQADGTGRILFAAQNVLKLMRSRLAFLQLSVNQEPGPGASYNPEEPVNSRETL